MESVVKKNLAVWHGSAVGGRSANTTCELHDVSRVAGAVIEFKHFVFKLAQWRAQSLRCR